MKMDNAHLRKVLRIAHLGRAPRTKTRRLPSEMTEEQKCASKHFEDVGKRASIPYVPRYKLKGVDPRIATKSMIGHVGQLRKSHTDRDPMDTAGDPLHPRVYDTIPTHRIHVHVLSERYFSAVTSTGKDSPRASNR